MLNVVEDIVLSPKFICLYVRVYNIMLYGYAMCSMFLSQQMFVVVDKNRVLLNRRGVEE